MIKGIAFVAYPSRDVARTRAWYEETLGLVFAGAYVEDGVEKYNEAHLDDGCFGLMAAEWTGRAAGSAGGVFFAVDDLEAAMRSLRDKGIVVADVFDGPSASRRRSPIRTGTELRYTR